MEELILQVLQASKNLDAVCVVISASLKSRDGAEISVIEISVIYEENNQKTSIGPVDIPGSVSELYKFWDKIKRTPIEGWKCNPLLSGEKVNEVFSGSMDVPGMREVFGNPVVIEELLMKCGNEPPQLIFTRNDAT